MKNKGDKSTALVVSVAICEEIKQVERHLRNLKRYKGVDKTAIDAALFVADELLEFVAVCSKPTGGGK